MFMCLFCQIIKKEISSEIVYENEEVFAFKDIKPKAPFHFLILPKKHIASVNDLKEEDKDLMGKLILVAKRLAKQQGLLEKGYKLVFNVGRGGGQFIDHIHLHFLAGKPRELP
jgi:histidine triad (HIT) family protein